MSIPKGTHHADGIQYVKMYVRMAMASSIIHGCSSWCTINQNMFTASADNRKDLKFKLHCYRSKSLHSDGILQLSIMERR